MADTVTSKVVFSGRRKYVIHLTNTSDGTGESNVLKIDKSTLVGPEGKEPSKLVIEKIEYDVSSMRVLLTWDQTSDETIAVLQGHGCLDWRKSGRLVGANTGGAGDVLLTTANQSSGDGYDITIYCLLKGSI